MADQNSAQYTSAYITLPTSKLEPKELNGRIRRIYVSHLFTSDLAQTEIVKLCKLPANAAIQSVRLVDGTGGSAGTCELGWLAGAEGLEVADQNGLLASFSAGAAINQSMNIGAQVAGYNKKFAESVDIVLTSTNASAADLDTNTIEMEIEYVID